MCNLVTITIHDVIIHHDELHQEKHVIVTKNATIGHSGNNESNQFSFYRCHDEIDSCHVAPEGDICF